MGWACFNEDGTTLDELLLAADRAMYADKSRRKNAGADPNKTITNDLGQYRVM
jgi:GGDEF domain-containing protein